MLAAGDQADKVACQAEACDLAPSVRQQLEQPQRPDRHIVDVPHGVAFTEQRTARPERHDRDDRFGMGELVLDKRGPAAEMAALAAETATVGWGRTAGERVKCGYSGEVGRESVWERRGS